MRSKRYIINIDGDGYTAKIRNVTTPTHNFCHARQDSVRQFPFILCFPKGWNHCGCKLFFKCCVDKCRVAHQQNRLGKSQMESSCMRDSKQYLPVADISLLFIWRLFHAVNSASRAAEAMHRPGRYQNIYILGHLSGLFSMSHVVECCI